MTDLNNNKSRYSWQSLHINGHLLLKDENEKIPPLSQIPSNP